MIEVENLSVRYGRLAVLDRVSFTLTPGRPLVVIGESGAGKTSLAKALMRLSDGCVEGRLWFDGDDVMAFDERRLRRYRGRQAALVVQATADALNPQMKVLDQVVDAMTAHGWPLRDARERALSLLRRQGLASDVAGRFPAGLSGGEIQRVLLAMALANRPALLILDEPTAALDPDTRRQALATIREVSRDGCVLLITHDFEAMREIGIETAVLYGGHLIEQGPTAAVVGAPRHPYTRGLLRAQPDRLVGKDLQGVPGRFERRAGGCPFFNRCRQVIDVCETADASLVASDDDATHRVACHRGGIVAALTARGLWKSQSGRPILRGLDLTLFAGETVAVLGESGSGKSTLARILAGLDKPDAGVVSVNREGLAARGIGAALVPQHPQTAIAAHFTIKDAVTEPLALRGDVSQDDQQARTVACLAAVQLATDDAFLARRAHSLSGGELQRVAIARALVQDLPVLIADEATSALDVSVQAKIVRLLMDLQEQRGLSMIFITHDRALADRVADRLVTVDRGRLVPLGNAGVNAPVAATA